MNAKGKDLILYLTLIILGLVFLFYGLIKAEKFLVPFAIAAILSMIVLPVARKLTGWGFSKGLAVLVSDLLLLAFFVGLFFLIGMQIENIADDWPQYKEKLEPKIEKLQDYVANSFGIPEDKQQQEIQKAIQSKGAIQGARILGKVTSLAGNFILIFIYIFFFVYYRHKFKQSVLNFVPREKRDHAAEVMGNFSKVSQQYLFGRFLLIMVLVILYSIGLSIVGIKHAILISILAALLSLIPYLGNVIGIFLALAMSLLANGTLMSIIGVLIVFTIAQFFESYILEPYVVGHKVELNPVLTLIGVIIGGFIWGIAGMIIAIPVMGILKVIFDSIPILHPFGYILDESDVGSEKGWLTNVKDKLVSKFKND